MKEHVYRFPENRRADAASMSDQLRKVREEACEAHCAYIYEEGSGRIIEELWDVIQAAEGALRKFPLPEVVKGLALVKIKSRHRGDYRKAE
jgi:hypothetical protein